MRTFLTILLILTGLRAQVPSHRVLDEATAAVLRSAIGREPFAWFAAWTRDELAPGGERLDSEQPLAVTRALRGAAVCGLWSPDPAVAFGAACHVDERSMDLADIDRYLAITLPHLFDETVRHDWQVQKRVVSSAQVARILAMRVPVAAEMRGMHVSDLHRSMRPEHIPALCRLVHGDDPLVRRQAFGVLANLSLHTSRHRDSLAAMLLAWPGPAAFEMGDGEGIAPYRPRTLDLPVVAPGYSARLRAVLRRWFLERELGVESTNFEVWLHRWETEERPSALDRALLGELAASPHELAQQIAAHGLHLLDGGTVAASAPRPSGWEQAYRAIDEALRVDETADRRLEGLERIRKQWDDLSPAWLSLLPELSARLRALAIERATALDGPRLHYLLRSFPECRATPVLAAALAALDETSVAECASDALESFDVEGLRARLLSLLPKCDEVNRDAALTVLAKLGAPEAAESLIAWAGDDHDRVRWLARSAAAPAIRKRLEDGLRLTSPVLTDRGFETPPEFVALAVANGVPETAAVRWWYACADVEAGTMNSLWTRWVARLVDGAGVDVLGEALAAGELPDLFVGLGEVADPRALAQLHRLRRRPGFAVQDVIAELAIAGDPDAVAELAEVRSRHLYGWMDDALPRHLTLGTALDLVPYWIEELGTICCRRVAAHSALDFVTSMDSERWSDRDARSLRDAAHAWWMRFGPHLRWSKIAGRYVVGPH